MATRPLSIGFSFALIALSIGLVGCGPRPAPSRPLRLANIFSDHAVLQRDLPLPIWGWDTPGAEITVHLAGQRKLTQAGPGGKWLVTMDPLPAGGPHLLSVSGTGSQIREDIWIGEVWICSGQSNMEWPVSRAQNSEKELADAGWPQIRLLKIPRRTARDWQWDIQSKWEVCTPQTVESFSAVGFFFGKQLHKQLDVPIGLIDSSYSGTPAEAWTPEQALAASDTFAPRVEQTRRMVRQYQGMQDDLEATYQKLQAEYEGRWEAYLQKVRSSEAGREGKWHQRDLNDTAWAEAELPGLWDYSYLPNFDGVVWFRRTLEIPKSWAGKDLQINLGPIDDDDVTYFNGQMVGHIGYGGESATWWTDPRTYTIPGELVQDGTNTIAVRVLDLNGNGGFAGSADQMTLRPVQAGDNVEPIRLAGTWKYKVGYRADEAQIPRPPARHYQPTGRPHEPAVLYNGMIAPLVPYGIAGVLWYQGEANAGRPEEYAELLPLMIRSWRKNWGQLNDFAFYIVQLANFSPVAKSPNQGGWAWIREAQAQTAHRTPDAGLAVTIDVGDPEDIHPRDKQTVGRRLALLALNRRYGFELLESGPTYLSHRVIDNEVIIRFKHVGQGLVNRGDDENINGFAITGDGRTWHWAEARIRDGKVVVWSERVQNPISVRYLWASNPGPVDLYNTANLPAGPFRTDTWPRTQQP